MAVAQERSLHRIYFVSDEVADVSYSDSLWLDPPQRLHGRIGLGGGVVSGFGHTAGYTFVMPELSYRISDRLALGGGIGMMQGTADIAPRLQGMGERSLAPRRRKMLNSMHLDATFQPNERLTVAASVFMMQGNLLPLLRPDTPDGYALGASAALHYRFDDNRYLSLYIEYIRGENMPLWPYGAPWGMECWPYYSMAGPTGCRHIGFGFGE